MKNFQALVAPMLLAGLLAALCGCAVGRTKVCADLAGPGWTPLSAPPANAADLLALENLPGGPEVSWYANGPDRSLACFYGASLNNPSCGGTTAYEFAKKDGRWVSRDLRSQVCPIENDT